MDIKRKKEDFKALSKVVKKASLIEIFLHKCNVEREKDALDYPKVGANISVSSKLSHEHEDEHLFFAESTFKLTGSTDDDKEVVKINCTYMLTYHLEDRGDFTPDEIDSFCDINALYNAWPFFRELVLNMCNRMEIPSFTLPLLKIVPRKEKRKSQTSE